jgi:MFS family permease
MMPMFLAMIDQTIVAAALPSIGVSLGGVDKLSWVVVSYLFAAMVAAPVYGRLGDVFGRRRFIWIALLITMAGSLLCMSATSIDMLIAARAIQGLGGGGLMTLSQALVSDAIEPRERAGYQGYLATVAVFANALGPVAGGLLTEQWGWRSVFLVNIPLGMLALALVGRLPVGYGTREPFKFDAFGLLLLTVFTGAVLLMLQQVKQFDGLRIAVLLFVGCLAATLLVWWEKRARVPLLPVALFRDPSVWRSDLLAIVHGAVLVSLFTLMPIYFRVAFGASIGEAGILLLPATTGIGIGALVTGRLIKHTGHTTIFPSVGLILVALLVATMAFAAPWLNRTAVMWLLGLNSMLLGTVMGVVQLTVQVVAGNGMRGAAAASVQFARAFGAAIGTTLVLALLFAVLFAHGPEAFQMFTAALEANPPVSHGLTAHTGSEAIDAAFRTAFLTISAFALVASGIAWTIPLRRV